MTQEDKSILLKDLSARLLYRVNIKYKDTIRPLFNVEPTQHYQITLDNAIDGKHNGLEYVSLDDGSEIKPYLRPMSSMTEEEFELLKQYSGLEYDQLDLAEFPNNHKCLDFYLSEVPSYVVIQVFDWLNKYHFDYRLLIEKGLALEAPEGMYK